MTELTQTEIPPLEEENWETVEERDEEAPWGYKADGTPRKRPGRKPGSTSSGGSKPRKSVNQEQLADRLVEYFGPPLAFVSPLGLAVFEERADKTSAALLNLAKRRPRIAKMLDTFIAGSSSVDLALTVIGVGVAMQVERERVHPDAMVSSYFHIDQIYREMYPEGIIATNGHVQAHGLIGEV